MGQISVEKSASPGSDLSGNQQTDRNLYVDGATVGGVAVPGGTLSLYTDGTQGFKFTYG